MKGSFSHEVQEANRTEEERYALKKLRQAFESASANLADAEVWARQTRGGEFVSELLSARDLVNRAFQDLRGKLGESTEEVKA